MLRNHSAQNASSTVLLLDKMIAMPTCYCKQTLATLAPPPGSSDLKISNSFNLTRRLQSAALTCEMLQKIQDVSVPIIQIHLARAYIEKQWKSSALEWENTLSVNTL